MSQLEKNTTDLQAILAQVNALPDAGSGGGSGGATLETCMVDVNIHYEILLVIVYSKLVDGVLTPTSVQAYSGSPYTATLENVVCGCPITMRTGLTGGFDTATVYGNVEILEQQSHPVTGEKIYAFNCTETGNGSITISTSDGGYGGQ